MNSLTLLHLPDGRLGLQTKMGPTAVQISYCFPWTEKTKYLSLRDPDGNEAGFIKDIEEIEPASRALLEQEIAQSTGTFQITSIQSLRKEIELRCWEVTTDRGARSFQTELDEWPRELPNGSFLIEDLFGDLYVVNSLQELDSPSRKLFWPLIS